jgi:hypothetical protein
LYDGREGARRGGACEATATDSKVAGAMYNLQTGVIDFFSV